MGIIPSEHIPIDLVHPNDWNPNHMQGKVYEFLKKNISSKGFYQPIVVIKDPNSEGYVIIDGEHRWRAAKESGFEEIEVKVLDIPLTLAKAETINANRIKGIFNPLELGGLLNTIKLELPSDILLDDICVIPPLEIELLTDISNEMDLGKEGREEIKKVQKNFQISLRFENKNDCDEVKELLVALLNRSEEVNMNGTIVKRALEAYLAETA